MISRRQFVKWSAAVGAATAVPWQLGARSAHAARSQQVPLPASAIPQFVDPVPNLLDADHLIPDTGTQIVLEMRERQAMVLPAGAVAGYAGSWTWSYLKPGTDNRASYLGPVILASRGAPTEIKFINNLGTAAATNVLAYKHSTDQTLHWAAPGATPETMFSEMAMAPKSGEPAAQNYEGSIPACVHLHGGEVPPELDGGPDAWYTSDGQAQGHGYYSKNAADPTTCSVYRYPNTQEGALIWFHDHTLGATRLNVYAGLAGAYLIADPEDTVLPTLPPLTPLVIQDRMFDTNGQLFFPADSGGNILWALNPEHPYWVPEFTGDVIVVNGKSWPFMNVEPKRYTFMLINGSNARTYELALTDQVSKNPGPPLWVIATDGGYLDAPVKIDPTAAANNVLPMMPGERYWVIVDFKGYEAGVIGPNRVPYSGQWLLKNNAKTPYPAGAAPKGTTVGRVMQFRVAGGPVADTSYNPANPGPVVLRTSMVRLAQSAVQLRRRLTLNEVMGPPKIAPDPVTGATIPYPGGPMEVLVNNTKYGGERITGTWVDETDPANPVTMYTKEAIPGFTPASRGETWLSEVPKEGETEVWEIVNLTADAHPIHLHLVQFQLLNRQGYNTSKYTKAYAAAFPSGYDYVAKATVGPGVFIPAFGPPLDYNPVGGGVVGGNPDVTPFLQGPVMPPLPHENGWKDTVIVLPGQVTRIVVRWAPTDLLANTLPENASFPFNPGDHAGYVWHCHIVDHEDNEMMRPNEVTPNREEVDREYRKGTHF